ncbi:N-methylhydantoinase A [Variovorax paradoxus]|uniref:N-methylhydantoinase A n=1 Tax=Variovorax paradoxus TaxID=34073 RepID=A0AAE4C042_VARPD|nr:hydantoinase/oxoprolinase family protein [Variovorax paradoxus]MDP9965474.1 N-methylhydantoinase A [Variovorax paradoxus]MDR6428732.1 N-methylhydantoinase A [Variovorax paradoxus]MDR6455942.1 N-methylhydantoinase A [Variovorax paradoxus]
MKRSTRIGVDIGGTFTDFVLHDDSRGVTRIGKRLTTPDAPSRAIVEGIERLLAETNTGAAQIGSIVHGTTLITNTVLERTGAKIGLLCTEGFRDVLEMGRESRYDVDDLFLPPVPVIVARRLRRPVRGRLLASGVEHEPLNLDDVVREVRWLVETERIEALAIAFMHAYRNPDHERRALEAVRALYPDLLVTLSSEVAPEIREYERTNTACVNAYVQPRVHAYLGRLASDLAGIGFEGDLYIMLSGGGITTVEDARRFPVRLIESGPAAGAMAAAFVARQIGEDHMISFDMGGTTAKMCLIEGGKPNLKHEFEAGRIRKFKQGSGLPLKLTVVDLIEIGTGGGSIAAVDANGLMKVGPRSAGAQPGPVAYERGGTEPTVTDADLVLGYLNPKFFLGGEMALSLEAVRRAMQDRLGDRLGIDAMDAARGIQAIANETMAAATRMHLAEKGKDPRAHSLMAFGGAGAVHGYALARLLKVPRLIVPMGAGVISALGFLVAAPAVDEVRGYLTRLDGADWPVVNALFAQMEAASRDLLASAALGNGEIAIRRQADMRYVGQGFDVTVDLPGGPLDASKVGKIKEAFNAAYLARFGRVVKGVAIEAVNWRLQASLPAQDITLAYSCVQGEALRGEREVYFDGFGFRKARVYDRYVLAPGVRIAGPAVVEERESSCSFGPDCSFTVDRFFNLVVDIDHGGRAATQARAELSMEDAR